MTLHDASIYIGRRDQLVSAPELSVGGLGEQSVEIVRRLCGGATGVGCGESG